jgi:hypothetical protein
VTCDRSVVFSGHSGFLHHISARGVVHHNPNPISTYENDMITCFSNNYVPSFSAIFQQAIYNYKKSNAFNFLLNNFLYKYTYMALLVPVRKMYKLLLNKAEKCYEIQIILHLVIWFEIREKRYPRKILSLLNGLTSSVSWLIPRTLLSSLTVIALIEAD